MLKLPQLPGEIKAYFGPLQGSGIFLGRFTKFYQLKACFEDKARQIPTVFQTLGDIDVLGWIAHHHNTWTSVAQKCEIESFSK